MLPAVKNENIEKCIDFSKYIPDNPGFYIIHFPDVCPHSESSLGHASHYSGSAASLRDRYIEHVSGHGGNLLRVSNLRNGKYIPKMFFLSFSTFHDAYIYEQYSKKKLKNPKMYCPLCGRRNLPILPENAFTINRAVEEK